jgi:DNA-binding NarL/FixJ family response regulator
MPLRCLIVDDSRHFLEAARGLLEREGFDVVGVASTAADAVSMVQELRPDVALVDVQLGNESGFDLAQQIHGQTSLHPSRVILISTYAEDDLVDLIADAPVAAFLRKSRLSGNSIRQILDVDVS